MVVFNEHYFTKAYTEYRLQNPPRKIAWYRAIINHFIAGKSTVSILDVGCGYGYFIESVPSSWDRYAIDPAHDLLRKNRIQRQDISFVGGEIHAMPLSASFDVVTVFDVLEHVPHLDEAGRSLAATLAPGGILMFVVPVVDGPAGYAVRLLDKDTTHLHMCARRKWLEWTRDYFDLLWWCGIMRGLVGKSYYLHIPTVHWRYLTPAIAVVAGKKGFGCRHPGIGHPHR